MKVLTQELYDDYWTKGWLVVNNVFSEEDVEEVNEAEPEMVAETNDASLYYCPRSFYDSESGWSYRTPGDGPKPLPANLTRGIKNAISAGIIISWGRKSSWNRRWYIPRKREL